MLLQMTRGIYQGVQGTRYLLLAEIQLCKRTMSHMNSNMNEATEYGSYCGVMVNDSRSAGLLWHLDRPESQGDLKFIDIFSEKDKKLMIVAGFYLQRVASI